jgi:hypothetical protein
LTERRAAVAAQEVAEDGEFQDPCAAVLHSHSIIVQEQLLAFSSWHLARMLEFAHGVPGHAVAEA